MDEVEIAELKKIQQLVFTLFQLSTKEQEQLIPIHHTKNIVLPSKEEVQELAKKEPCPFIKEHADEHGNITIEKLLADPSMAEYTEKKKLLLRALLETNFLFSSDGKSFRFPGPRYLGRVRKYVQDKNMGFIGGDGSEQDLYFNQSCVRNQFHLMAGDMVVYYVDKSRKGKSAEARDVILVKNVALSAESPPQYRAMDVDDYLEYRSLKNQQRHEGKSRYKTTGADASTEEHECPHCHQLFSSKPIMEHHINIKHPGLTEYLQELEDSKKNAGNTEPQIVINDEVIQQVTTEVNKKSGVNGFRYWIDSLRLNEVESKFTVIDLTTIESLKQITSAQEETLLKSLNLGMKKRVQRALASLANSSK